MSADDSHFVSEFATTANATSTAGGDDDDDFSAELVSQGDSLSGTDATVTSSRWIQGWRGCEQQVVSVAVTNGSLSGTFSLRYGDQATAPLDVNASAEAIEVRLEIFAFWDDFHCNEMSGLLHTTGSFTTVCLIRLERYRFSFCV